VLSANDRFMVDLGDRIDCIPSDDKRYDTTAQEPIPLKQARRVIKDDSPLSPRLLAWLLGNHEWKLWRHGNLSQFMAEELRAPYGTYTTILRVYDKYGEMYRMWLSHGYGMLQSNAKDHEQRIGNMKAALKMKMKEKASDVALHAMGHTHQLIVCEPAQKLYLTYESDKPKQHYLEPASGIEPYIDADRRWFCNTGSFLKLYADGDSGYAEMKGYNPVEIGAVRVIVRDRKIVNVEKMVV
jgi:hypothetical protein